MRNTLSKDNIHTVLKTYFPKRFNGLLPFDFEKVIQILLNEKFDSAILTKKTGDFGADVIVKDGQQKVVVEVKRYNKSNKVSNRLINNLIAAKNYYNCDKGLFITTSDYTKAANVIAEKSNIELWNWNKLTQEISKIFWNGNSYNEFYGELKDSNGPKNGLKGVEIELEKIDYSYTDKGQPAIWIYISIKNLMDEVVDLNLYDIKVLSHDSKQYDIDGFQTGYFNSGNIYPGAIVTSSFFLNQNKFGKIKEGAKIILSIAKKNENRFQTEETLLVVNEKIVRLSVPNNELDNEELGNASTVLLIIVFIFAFVLMIIGIVSSH